MQSFSILGQSIVNDHWRCLLICIVVSITTMVAWTMGGCDMKLSHSPRWCWRIPFMNIQRRISLPFSIVCYLQYEIAFQMWIHSWSEKKAMFLHAVLNPKCIPSLLRSSPYLPYKSPKRCPSIVILQWGNRKTIWWGILLILMQCCHWSVLSDKFLSECQNAHCQTQPQHQINAFHWIIE